MKEERKSRTAMFITLTYDTDHVDFTNNGFMNLNKRHVQLFMKKLRKCHNGEKLKYYCAGEYGEQKARPHYHMLLFNADVNKLGQAWEHGQIHVGSVTAASVGYTLKYMCKEKRIPMHARDDRQKEFALMSKGLGIEYLTPAMIAWHHADLDNRVYCVIEDGKKVSMPRYYKDKIYSDQQRERVAFFGSIRAQEATQKAWEELTKEYGDKAPKIQAERHMAAFRKLYKSSKNRM